MSTGLRGSTRVWVLASIAALLAAAEPATAAVYPTNTCVSKKLSAAATACQKALTAWSTWVKDPSKDPGSVTLNAAITAAGQKFAQSWDTAEAAASAAGADCKETTVPSSDALSALTVAAGDIATLITSDADTSNKADRKCRAKLLQAAATECSDLLKAESALIKGLTSDPQRTKRDQSLSKAAAKFNATWSKAACSTTVTPASIATNLSNLSNNMVTDTTISPSVPDAWTMITPAAEEQYQKTTLKPMCAGGTPYAFFVKRGTLDKLLVYYEGGGACWDYLTCGPAQSYDSTVGASDNPALDPTGFFDFTNPANPFADWNWVFVPYCTGDVHWGDATVTYQSTSSSDSVTIQHKGFVNAQAVEKWTREHFVNPPEVLVTGSSAGAYGALLNSLYFQEKVYPASRFEVFADAGSGVITQRFLTDYIQNWGIRSSLPKWIPALNKPIAQLAIDQLAIAAAAQYPRTKFGGYTTAWDDTQTTFYNIMVNQDDISKWGSWWLSSCDWDGKMRTLVKTTAAGAPNYRYYIGPGSKHTVFAYNKVYTDTTGGVPLVVDWLNAMLADSPSWTNAECSNCDLLPGDKRPNPLAAPFGANGAVTCP